MRTLGTQLRTFVLALASALLVGCVYTPVAAPERLSAQFGGDADAVFRVGAGQREAIFARFGRPSFSTQHDLACGYLFACKTGSAKGLLMGPCMPYIGSTDTTELDDVWLEFDQNGLLRRVAKRLVVLSHKNSEAAWRQFVSTVPDKLRPEQMVGVRP